MAVFISALVYADVGRQNVSEQNNSRRKAREMKERGKRVCVVVFKMKIGKF